MKEYVLRKYRALGRYSNGLFVLNCPLCKSYHELRLKFAERRGYQA